MKLILLCLAHNTSEAHSKKRNRTYEVNENYPLDYPAQKSVFHLHFWFKKTLERNNDPLSSDVFDTDTSEMDKNEERHVLTKPVINKIMQEALSTLHYLVEIRHKSLCKNVSDSLHDKLWNTGLNKHTSDFLTKDELMNYINSCTDLVLEELIGSESTSSNTIPSIPDLFDIFAASNDTRIFK